MFQTPFTYLLLLSVLILNFTCFAQSPFQTVNAFSAGQGIELTPEAGDYDRDGDIDILGTGYETALFRNDGGDFSLVNVQLPQLGYGGMFKWADLDNDNDLDIVTGGCNDNGTNNTSQLSIYRNDGGDQFTLIEVPTNLICGSQFSLADFNNDGLIDIEIETPSESNNNVIVGHTFYINHGDFSFQQTFDINKTFGKTTWTDLNNDGWLDFILLDEAFKNLKDGTFESFTASNSLPRNEKFYSIDADNDGNTDLITRDGILLSNDGTGQLTSEGKYLPFKYIRDLLVVDFNGDGYKDIVAAGGNSSTVITQYFQNNGDGTYTADFLYDQYIYSYNLAAADMDNDNDPDLILSGVYAGNTVILLNDQSSHLLDPVSPGNLQTVIDNEHITFSWDAATDNEQSSLHYNMYLSYNDGYIITPNADTSTGFNHLPGNANAFESQQKQIQVMALSDGYFQWGLQAVDDELNTSQFSLTKEFTLYKNNPADAPTNLSKSIVEDRSVSFTWTDNSSNETSYTVERSSINGNTGFESIAQVAANVTSYVDNTVEPLVNYYYRIRIDGTEQLAYSNVISIKTNPGVDIAPFNLMASAETSATARIDWEYIGPSDGFVIERSHKNKSNFIVVDTVDAGVRTFTDQQLESGTNYYYRIYSIDGIDYSQYSNIDNITLPFKEFEKVTLASLDYESRYDMGAIAWGDYDNDGFDDLFLGYEVQLYHNEGDGTFQKITETGIAPFTPSYGFVASWGDYNNDGFLDLFYYNNADKSALYKGFGDGTFFKVNTVINSERSDISNATWTDFDMDGDLDLSITGSPYVFRYDGNDTFTKVKYDSSEIGYSNNYSIASWADYDDDGDPDVFLGNYGDDRFFQNNGDGSFTEITDQRITSDYNFDCCPIATHTVLWADFNNDNKLDLTTYHAGGPIYTYENNENSFDSAFYSYKHNRQYRKNIFWTDYDSDGDLDLFAMGHYNMKTDIWETKEGIPFNKITAGLLYDVVENDAMFSWNDYDNDGFSDLFEFDENHQIYKNISNQNNWLKIRLKGRTSNSTGLGAKVFVKSNSEWQRSDVTTHHSYRVQQGFMLLFGLGKAEIVDSIKVHWPSGNKQYLTDVEVNQVLLIDEINAQETVLPAPSNLTAEVSYPSSILLNWTDRSASESGFVIEMMTDGGQFEEIGSVEANIETYEIKNLTLGETYKFRVRSSPSPTNRWTNIAEAQIRLFTEVFAGDISYIRSKTEGLAWGDPDGDGDPDLFIGSETFEPDAIYYNDNGYFTRSPLGTDWRYSQQAHWVDYNNDGYQDLHVSVGGSISGSPEYLNDVLYKNNGSGLLIEQTDNILSEDGFSDYTAAWGDITGNGHLDMITPRSNERPMLYTNENGEFTIQNLSFDLDDGAEIILTDFDSDRDLDIISTDYYNSLNIYKNGNGQFTAYDGANPYISVHSFVLEDFDNDNDFDLLITDSNRKLRLLLFDSFSLKYTEYPNVFEASPTTSQVSVGDFDNNGYLDVFAMGVNNAQEESKIYLNQGGLNFASLNDPILERFIHGSAIADINKDGQLDMVVVTSEHYFDIDRYILQGNKSENNWFRVKLRSNENNRFGIGAKVKIFTGNTTQVREIRTGSNKISSHEQVAHFGLGSYAAIDYVKVEWPSGVDQWITNPDINTELIVERASASGPPAPTSPTGLVGTARFPGYFDLSWNDNSEDEMYFRLERAIGSSSFEPFIELSKNTTTYTDSTFANNNENRLEVKYRVVAVSSYTVVSEPSNIVEFVDVRPNIPSNTTAMYQSSGYIDINWNDNSNNEQLFRIERATGIGPFLDFKYVKENITSYTDSSFVNSEGDELDVKYRIVAISISNIESSPSNTASISVIAGLDNNSDDLVLYPQPATSEVTIHNTRVIKSISIINGNGVTVEEIVDPGLRKVTVPVSKLSPGIYFIRITDTKEVFLKKVVIRKDK
ncbi:T9SS type A sorting domain-containing protein [Fulvivirga sp. RKSG066]|uniref:FG-GAP-like repeat-containing protein n=1 Tax=Fulvivirga aurantia TaxID=2529383 RepID=UPI0012BD766E|nr:FG-GAP-like repeat-containing protein [Fulvivirga aurantia]MTI20946.1 T9SS type A sorting domain-containing protein [Fulvivirga aurantia]